MSFESSSFVLSWNLKLSNKNTFVLELTFKIDKEKIQSRNEYLFSQDTLCYEPSELQQVYEVRSTSSTEYGYLHLLLRLYQGAARAEVLASPCSTKEQEEHDRSSLVYRDPQHDSLMDRVQLILSLDLLLRLLSCNPLLPSDCLHCLKTPTNLSKA